MRSFKWKTFESFLWLLKAIWSVQKSSKPLRDFLNLVLVFKEISPRYGNDKNKVFFLTFINWGRLIKSLSTNVLKQLSKQLAHRIFLNIIRLFNLKSGNVFESSSFSFLFLPRIRFPKNEPISSIVRKRYSGEVLKAICKFEKSWL